MSSIPANLGRVPNLLASQLLLSTITRTNVDLLTVQTQMASGKRVSRFSDDAIAAGAIGLLQQRLASGSQILGNLSSAQNSLDFLDSSIGDATNLVREAKSIASGQIGVTSDATTRNNQAVVIDGMLRSLFQLANRETNGLYVFGGSTATRAPIEELHGGYRYVGRGSGLRADLGPAADVPITIGGDNAIGEVSARLRGTADLNPVLTGTTRLGDLAGARTLGISKGSITFSFNGGPATTVDLSQVDTVQDVQAALASAIQQYETANSVTILGPGGVSLSGGSISLDVAGAGSLTFGDVGVGQVAADLGLSQAAFTAGNANGADLNPRLNLLTPVSALSGVTVPMGTIRFRFTSSQGASIADVDLSSAQTLDDVRNLIETRVPGVRVQVNAAGSGIDLFNEIAGPSLSVEPTGTGPNTASELGIRSLDLSTRVSEFNEGRGIGIVDNRTDPITGTVTRALNTDFRITLGNGQAFDVDLRPQDMVDAQSILARINSEFSTAIGQPPLNASAPPLAPGEFSAGLATTGNGFAFTQTLGGTPSEIKLESLNNSGAAEDLGLLNGTYDATSATFTAQDTAGIRVQNIFTALVRLRDALRADSSAGITVAGGALDDQVNRLAQAQALVGVYANRVQQATQRQTSVNTTNEQLRSQLQDVDYTEAAIRYSNLRTQLQAALQTGAQSQNLSLLDFLR
ncbi:MAG TPA: flagellin [Phycisphaerales bacterium]|mgnify:CR=1 FL=1|nr:flagellin [Phycisphaerales bacterium]